MFAVKPEPTLRPDAHDVVSCADYAAARPAYTRLIRRARRERRVRIADDGVLQFEHPEFVLWHVQELLRCEGDSPTRRRRTLEDVKCWAPRPGSLHATFLLDTADRERGGRVCAALAEPGAVTLRAGQHTAVSLPVEPDASGEGVFYLRWQPGASWYAAAAHHGVHLATTWVGSCLTLPCEVCANLLSDVLKASVSEGFSLHRLVHAARHHVLSPSPRHTACA